MTRVTQDTNVRLTDEDTIVKVLFEITGGSDPSGYYDPEYEIIQTLVLSDNRKLTSAEFDRHEEQIRDSIEEAIERTPSLS